MSENRLIGLASILILGIAAQWLAWRIRLPAICLLLIFGYLAGPITGLLDSNELFGDLLLPLGSLAITIILFEAGLSLKYSEIRKVRGIE